MSKLDGGASRVVGYVFVHAVSCRKVAIAARSASRDRVGVFVIVGFKG